MWAAWTRHLSQRDDEWRRLQELARVLYNYRFSYGGWAQALAARELVERAKKNAHAASLKKDVTEFWADKPECAETAQRLLSILRDGKAEQS